MIDAELIRYLDGELEDAESEALSARLAAEPVLSERLDTLRRRAARLSALLAEADPTDIEVHRSATAILAALRESSRQRAVPAARQPWFRRAPVAMRIAAAITLLLGLALAVPPARAWVVERVRDVAEALGLTSAAAPVPEASPDVSAAQPVGAEVGVTFAVRPGTFEVQVSQPVGTLILRRGEGATGSAEASGVPGVSFVVLPGGLRIEGPASASATYLVTLPAEVTNVRVRIGDGLSVLHALPAGGDELRIDLSSP
ncbi:MAG: hypothetical protein HY701_07015 [Gemmatimonadetes bacterium]|nr:hypothetical protein [Gemmatimonadota bacterium]